MISQIATAYYFLHFLVVLPIVSSIERPEPMPFSITEAVLGNDDKAVLTPGSVARPGASGSAQPVPAA
jgi:ubiquinol-cytochrome c reductase cytochrome b subunit